MKLKIIGISGKMRSGKDTLAGVIIQQFPTSQVLRIAFADALKDEVAAACGVTRQFTEQNRAAFRHGWQWWGTEFRRDLCGKDYWTDRVEKTILMAMRRPGSYTSCVIITDVRFKNEYDFIRRNGGIIVRVNRKYGWIESIVRWLKHDRHSSECQLDSAKFDYVINADSLCELDEKGRQLGALLALAYSKK